ncbi:MAG: AAA family ATPase [Nitrospira sp.]|nr:AAA family ATPase [Nitrospira sp.]
MELQNFNPWWRNGRVPDGLTGRHRKVFDHIRRYADKRQIILFTGLRRAGKTTLMYQIIHGLIEKGVNPYHILYFSFDEAGTGLDTLINQYETEVLHGDLSNQKVFLFLDEIQKLKEWPSKIKLLYDLNPKVKIFLTGSAQITMWKGIRESLAGRFFDFEIQPLNFDEYLEFKDINIDKGRDYSQLYLIHGICTLSP